MSKTSTVILLTASAFALTGCDWFGGGSSADTEMKNVEILPGTASDEMITLDQASGDGTAVDASTAVGPVVPGAADASDDEEEDGDAPASSQDDGDAPEAGGGGDVVIRPPASGAEPDAPAKK